MCQGGEQVLAVFDVTIPVGARVIELVGVAHADQVHRNTPPEVGERRHDVAPQIRRGRVAVLEYDRRAPAGFDISHPATVNFEILFGQGLAHDDAS